MPFAPLLLLLLTGPALADTGGDPGDTGDTGEEISDTGAPLHTGVAPEGAAARAGDRGGMPRCDVTGGGAAGASLLALGLGLARRRSGHST